MDRALTTMSWVWVTLGVVALAALPFTGTTGRLTAIGVAAVVCVCASYIGWQIHGVSPLYPVVMLASGAYLFTFDLPARDGDMADVSSSEATIDVIANLVLVVGVALAVRSRRGGYSRRDVADGLTVLLGAMLVAWIAIANPLIQRRDLSAGSAILNSLSLPLSMILVVLVAALAGERPRAEPVDRAARRRPLAQPGGRPDAGIDQVRGSRRQRFQIRHRRRTSAHSSRPPPRSPIRRSAAPSTSAHPVSRSTRPFDSRSSAVACSSPSHSSQRYRVTRRSTGSCARRSPCCSSAQARCGC